MKPWSNLLPDLLESISDRLPLLDYVEFRGVCKSWRHAPSGRKEIASFDKKNLWLMLYGFDDSAPDKCYLYDNLRFCTFYFPHLRNATVLESKSGWLLARRRDDDDDNRLFLYSLFTLEKIDLPKHGVAYSEQVGSFAVPSATSSDFLVVLVGRRKTEETPRLEISLCRNVECWEVQTVDIVDDRFGTARAVECSDCNCVGGRCECEKREWKGTVYINGSKDGLYYDFVNKKVVNWAWHGDVHQHTFSTPRQNFRTRFGEEEEDISISVCAATISRGVRYCRVHPRVYELPADDNEEQVRERKLKVVAAAWVEPKFFKF